MPENTYLSESADFDHLRALGFTIDEIANLIYMKEHVADQVEYREMQEQQHRLNFIRWLVEHDRLSK